MFYQKSKFFLFFQFSCSLVVHKMMTKEKHMFQNQKAKISVIDLNNFEVVKRN